MGRGSMSLFMATVLSKDVALKLITKGLGFKPPLETQIAPSEMTLPMNKTLHSPVERRVARIRAKDRQKNASSRPSATRSETAGLDHKHYMLKLQWNYKATEGPEPQTLTP